MEEIGKLTAYDLKLARLGLQNLLDVYAVTGVPEGTEKVVEEFTRVSDKIENILTKISNEGG